MVSLLTAPFARDVQFYRDARQLWRGKSYTVRCGPYLEGKTPVSELCPERSDLGASCLITFRFTTTKQLRECINYYEQKTHPSSRIPAKVIAADIGPDWRELRSWDVERWFERLPMYLLEEPKGQQVLKALHKTLALVETGKL